MGNPPPPLPLFTSEMLNAIKALSRDWFKSAANLRKYHQVSNCNKKEKCNLKMLSISLEFKWLCIEEWQWGFIFVKFPSQNLPPPLYAPQILLSVLRLDSDSS